MTLSDDTEIGRNKCLGRGNHRIYVSDLSQPVRDYIKALEQMAEATRENVETYDCCGALYHTLAAVEAAKENLP